MKDQRTASALTAGLPHGWMAVPIEPTQEMLLAGIVAAEDATDSDWDSGADGEGYNSYTTLRSDAPSLIYRAMLNAAPKQEQQG